MYEESRTDIGAFPVAILFDAFDTGLDEVATTLGEALFAGFFLCIEIVPIDIVIEIRHDEIEYRADMDEPQKVLDE